MKRLRLVPRENDENHNTIVPALLGIEPNMSNVTHPQTPCGCGRSYTSISNNEEYLRNKKSDA